MSANSEIFSMSTKDLKALARLFKKSPLKMGKVAAGVLNTEAFGLRTSILKVFDKEMTIRSPGFVKSRVRVVKARTGPINSIESEAGSVFADRFDGWKEQQYGTKSQRKLVPTKFSRGGDWSGKVKSGFRSQPKNPMWKISDFGISNAKNKKHRLIIYLQILDKQKKGKRFFFPGSMGKMNAGIYKNMDGSIRGIKNPRSRVAATRRFKWMDKSLVKLRKEINPQETWERNVKFVFRLK